MVAKKDLKTLFLRFVFVACYCLIGAAIFYAIEHTDVNDPDVEDKRKKTLYNTTKHEILQKFGINETEFNSLVTSILDANSSADPPKEWTYTRGIDLCWQTLTTIGYGNKPPTTLAGQLFLIPFAIFGIPLTVFMLNTIGENICHFLGDIIKKTENKFLGRQEKFSHCKVKVLCSVVFLTIALIFFMAGISIKAEGWTFGQGLYVWFVTFSTIGFGDYIPGNGTDSVDGPIAIVYRLIFVILGLSLISTIFNAMTDCVAERRKKGESWLSFFISAFSSKSKESRQNDVTEMTENPTTDNSAEKQGV